MSFSTLRRLDSRGEAILRAQLKSLIYKTQSCEKFGLRVTPKERLWKAYIMKVWPIFFFQKSTLLSACTLLSVKATHLLSCHLPIMCKLSFFKHLLSRLAVALHDYQPCPGWEMSLINYTCKPSLFLNWIFHWMIQVSVKGSKSQPSCTFGWGNRRRHVRGKCNAHLSSLKLRLDNGRDILVIIRRSLEKWGFPAYNAFKQASAKTAFLFLTERESVLESETTMGILSLSHIDSNLVMFEENKTRSSQFKLCLCKTISKTHLQVPPMELIT